MKWKFGKEKEGRGGQGRREGGREGGGDGWTREGVVLSVVTGPEEFLALARL